MTSAHVYTRKQVHNNIDEKQFAHYMHVQPTRERERERCVCVCVSWPQLANEWNSQLLLQHPLNGLFSRTTWVSRYQKGKTSLDLNQPSDDGVLGCSGISWTTCIQCAPRSRQITTPTPHHSIFTGRMLFLTPNQQCHSTEGTKLTSQGQRLWLETMVR